MSADAVIAFGMCGKFNLELPAYFSIHEITYYEKSCGYAPPNTTYYIHTGLNYFDNHGGCFSKEFRDVILTLLNLLDDVNVNCVYYGYDCLDQTKLFTMQDWHDIVDAYEIAERKYNDYASL